MPQFCSMYSCQNNYGTMEKSLSEMRVCIYNRSYFSDNDLFDSVIGMNSMFPDYLFSNGLYFDCNLMYYLYFDSVNVSIWNECPVNTAWETSLVLL